MEAAGVRDPFVRNWVDLLSFLLSGLKADGTLAAEVVSRIGHIVFGGVEKSGGVWFFFSHGEKRGESRDHTRR